MNNETASHMSRSPQRRRRLGIPLTDEDVVINELVGGGWAYRLGGADQNICEQLKEISGIQDQRDAQLMFDKMRWT